MILPVHFLLFLLFPLLPSPFPTPSSSFFSFSFASPRANERDRCKKRCAFSCNRPTPTTTSMLPPLSHLPTRIGYKRGINYSPAGKMPEGGARYARAAAWKRVRRAIAPIDTLLYTDFHVTLFSTRFIVLGDVPTWHGRVSYKQQHDISRNSRKTDLTPYNLRKKRPYKYNVFPFFGR